MSKLRIALIAFATCTVGVVGVTGGPASAVAPTPTGELTLTPLGTFDGGGEAAAEIVAFDAGSKRAFITNGESERIDIVSFAVPSAPVLVASFDITPYGDSVQSVDVHEGVAVAAVGVDPDLTTTPPTAENGVAVFFTVDGVYIDDVEVGVLPDSLTFSSDGRTVVVANEAEPICASGDDDPAAATDPDGSVSIITVPDGVVGATVTTIDFSGFDKTALLLENVRIYFPGSSAAQDIEPEYVTIDPDGERAYVTLQENNALAVIDLATQTIIDVRSFGYKDHSAPGNLIDSSDRDGPSNSKAIDITARDVYGMYLPDGISAFEVGGSEYLVTANEGDARDYSCYSEEERISALDFTGSSLDPGLQANSILGRLNTTTAFPTQTPLEALFSYGARSFTVWDATGNFVWDSGDQFEQYFAATYPANFNGEDNDAATWDTRSDNKGPEPEGLIVGRIGGLRGVGGTPFVFVVMERMGGIAAYDLSDPTDPQFVTYVNPGLDGGSGPGSDDLAPEGITFVGGCESPTGNPLLFVANEGSGTTTVYEVTGGPAETCTPAPVPDPEPPAPRFVG